MMGKVTHGEVETSETNLNFEVTWPKRPVKNTVDQQRSWCQRQPQGLLLYSLDLLEKLDISDS